MMLFHHFEAVVQVTVLLFVFISKCYCLAGKTLGLCYIPILPASQFSQ